MAAAKLQGVEQLTGLQLDKVQLLHQGWLARAGGPGLVGRGWQGWQAGAGRTRAGV